MKLVTPEGYFWLQPEGDNAEKNVWLVGVTQKFIDKIGIMVSVLPPRSKNYNPYIPSMCMEGNRGMASIKLPFKYRVLVYNNELIDTPEEITATTTLFKIQPSVNPKSILTETYAL